MTQTELLKIAYDIGFEQALKEASAAGATVDLAGRGAEMVEVGLSKAKNWFAELLAKKKPPITAPHNIANARARRPLKVQMADGTWN